MPMGQPSVEEKKSALNVFRIHPGFSFLRKMRNNLSYFNDNNLSRKPTGKKKYIYICSYYAYRFLPGKQDNCYKVIGYPESTFSCAREK